MKLAIAVVLAACGGHEAMPDADTSGPVSHLPLDDADFGDVLRLDRGIHATCTTCPTIVPAHLLNGAQLDPSASLSLVTGPDVTAAQYTVAMWLSVTDANAGCAITDGWKLCVANGKLVLSGATADMSPGWHHVAVHATTQTTSLAVDGHDVAVATGALATDPDHLQLGGGFTGAIDDVQMWTRSLDAAELAALAAQ